MFCNKEVYEKNLIAIREINSAIAEWLDKEPDTSWMESIFCDDGITPNLLIKLPYQNRRITIYDQHKPKELAQSLAKQAQRYKQNTSILLGFGLGYVVQAILAESEEEHTIVVIERSATILRKALSIFDYSEKIKTKELIIGGYTDDNVVTVLNSIEQRFAGGDLYMNQESYIDLLPDIYTSAKELTIKTVNQIRSNMTTIITKGNEIALNELKSIPYAVRSRGVGSLFGLFKDKPIILVSTGPSLAKNIHLLKEASKGAIIIAVVQALKALLAYDIVPDFVTTIDYGELNRVHFEGIFSSSVPLITLCRASADIVKEYKGPKFIVGAPYAQPDYYLSRLWQLKGIVTPGNSVAHMNFVLAHAMGANPIVFVGQDLAISTTTHYNQIDHNSDVKMSEGQMKTTLVDKRSKHDGYEPDPEMILSVPGYYDNQMAVTRLVLFSFLASFEQMIQQVQAKVINATEGGVKIKGAERMSLQEVIAIYCQEDLDRSKLQELTSTPPEDANLLTEQLIPLLEQERQIFVQLISQCELAIRANKRMSRKHKKNILVPITAKDMVDNSTHTNAAQSVAKNVPLLNMAIFGAETEAKKREASIPYDVNDPKSVNIKLKKNKDVLSSVLKTAREMEQIYDSNIKLFKQYIECIKDENKIASLTLFRTLRDMGDWIGAKKYIDKLVNGEQPKVLQEAVLLAIEMEDFKMAKELIEGHTTDLGTVLNTLNKELSNLLVDNDDDLAAGNFARPILYAKKYLSAYPDHPIALQHLTTALAMRDKQIELAKEEYTKVHQNMTLGGEVHTVTEYLKLMEDSRELGRNQKYDESIAALHKAMELIPNRPEAKWGLASTSYFLGKVEEAEKLYQELLLEYKDNDQFTFELGLAQIKLNKVEEGVKNVETILARNESFNWFLAGIAMINISLKRYEKTIEQFDKYLEIVPGDYEVWYRKGEVLRLLGRTDEAEKMFNQAKKIKPDVIFEEGVTNEGNCSTDIQS